VSQPWWQQFFDEEYYEVWGGLFTPADSAREAEVLVGMLRLAPGSRVLDAPCGYGRLARALASRGVEVLGVDFSPPLLEKAQANRGQIPTDHLRYVRADLRYRHQALPDGHFDAALNMFSSLGYGSDDDDDAILRNLARTLKPGGLLFIDTMHRDAIILRMERGIRPGKDMENGVQIREFPRLDPVSGRIETTWRWTTAKGKKGQKSASIRLYTITELVQKLESAGFELVSLHKGCSEEPFTADDLGGRVGLLATRSDD
jgi:SAM-dependent methyltransferase